MSASSAVHEPARDGEHPPLQGARGRLLQVVAGEAANCLAEVVGDHGEGEPRSIGHERLRG